MTGESRAWGWSWVSLIAAFVVHIADEVASDALAFYNPVIREVTGRDLTFGVWMTALTVIVLVLASLTPFLFRRVTALKGPISLIVALMLLNVVQHLALFLVFQRLTPGTRSAVLLLAASLWVLRETRRISA
jgi:hypothetical protein